MTWLTVLAVVAAGYALGSVQVALLVARRHGVDLRRTGDGNPGAWNALEQLGARRAWPAFAGDGAKALAAGALGLALGPWWLGWSGVAGAMVGHALPVRAPAQGGKSVMCLVGGLLVLSPVAGLACVALCLAVSAAAGFAWGARVGVAAFPVVQLATDPVQHVMGTGVLMTLVGALFVLRRRTSGPAMSARDAAPRP
jgi:glycerol-3-phosphate acyltransferase PlsY